MSPSRLLPAGTTTPVGSPDPRHVAVMHEDDQQLYRLLSARMLSDALRGDDTVLVVLGPERRAGLDRVLRGAGVDLAGARAAGRYVELDAETLLAVVHGGDGVDLLHLQALVAGVDREARGRGGRLVVCSEMASLLWDRGLVAAALELEAAGDALLARHDLRLLCLYPTVPDDSSSTQVCAVHARVFGATPAMPATCGPPTPDVRPTTLAEVARQVEVRDQMLDAVDAAVVATDLDGIVQAWNDGARRFHGWTAGQAIGRRIDEVTVPADRREAAWAAFRSILPQDGWEGELDGVRPDGTTFPVHVRNRVLRDATGTPTGIVGVAVDMSGQVERERSLVRRHAWLRNVTDLMGEGLATLDAEGRIATVNPRGEQLLAAGGRAVIGGSFVNRLLPVAADGSVEALSEHLIGADFDGQLPGEPVEARLLRPDGTTLPIEYVATELPAEEDGRGPGWVVVFRDIADRLERQRQLRADADHTHWMGRIQRGLDEDRFVLHAQPIVDLHTSEVIQHELLVRLDDPDDGLVSPGAFLPTAERYGLVTAIDQWVVGQALAMASAGMPVEVNLSARSFVDPALPPLIAHLLAETGADPSLVVFELTETAMLDNHEEAARFADRVRSLGCQLALDDFGTGHGALVHLKRLPVDYLKIDMEFVRDAVDDAASRSVIEAIVSLARSLGIRTIAEGIEDPATRDLLVGLGVDQGQGFHFGRPAPLD